MVATTNPTKLVWLDNNPNARRDTIADYSVNKGLKAGAVTFALCLPSVLVANRVSPTFRTRLNASAKTLLTLMPSMAVFSYVGEINLARGKKHPERFLEAIEAEKHPQVRIRSNLKWWQQAANHVYDHPYKSLMAVSTPLVASIFAAQHANKAITVSQQVMTTRIYSQASVVVLLLSAMLFHDFMQEHGRFEAEQKEE